MADIQEISINSNVYDIKAKSIVNQNGGSLKYWTGTKAQYDAIATKDANTLYFVDDITPTSITVSLANDAQETLSILMDSMHGDEDAGLPRQYPCASNAYIIFYNDAVVHDSTTRISIESYTDEPVEIPNGTEYLYFYYEVIDEYPGGDYVSERCYYETTNVSSNVVIASEDIQSITYPEPEESVDDDDDADSDIDMDMDDDMEE